jgi:three-Cys-motif partner protein
MKKRGVEPRPTQTKVKHTILENYLKAWGGIIINGLYKRLRDLHLVYIDCNASYGRFNGELEDTLTYRQTQPIFGSPIIGIKELDSLASWAETTYGVRVRTNSILFENDSQIFAELKRSLEMAGLTARVRETSDFYSLRDGEVSLLFKDSTSMASKLISYTQSGFTFSFFALDPYGPKGIPLSFVGEIIRQQRHDVIINFPYYDLHKKSGIVPRQNQTSVNEKLLNNYDALFGNSEWQAIVRALDTDAIREGQEALYRDAPISDTTIEAQNLEIELMNCYERSLLSADPDLTVKSIGLHFPDKERTIYYLYLTTHDPTGSLKMNEVLWNAGYQEHELRWGLMELRRRGDQLPLFEVAAPSPKTPQRTSIEDIAKQIYGLFRGKTITKKDIYTALADEPYFAREVDRALTQLKKQKLASFDNDKGINTLIAISRG